MKKYLYLFGAFVVLFTISVSVAQAGVSVSIGQPGFYGQLDIGDYYPRPQVLYVEPRVIYLEPTYRYAEPIYLRVPPGHAKGWRKYCGRYNACGRPVYFVQDTWYQNVYAPRYQEYRLHGDDGRRYDRDYWNRHDHDDKGNWKHSSKGHDKRYGHGKDKSGKGSGHGRD